MLSVQGTPSVDSLAPHLNVSGVRMPLMTLCGLIAQCTSLERAKIISVECYKEWTKYGVIHRFLVFHLRRSERSDVWLRLDRRPAAGATISKLIRVKGRTAANDTVRIHKHGVIGMAFTQKQYRRALQLQKQSFYMAVG